LEVTVAIPTHKNDGKTIFFTLQALSKQTFSDFSLLIAYKPSENDHTLDVVEKFTKELDIKVLIQSEGHLDEAMNSIYSASKGDILITTDDDSVPSLNWVEAHVNAHEKHYDSGVLGPFSGLVRPSSFLRSIYGDIFEIPLESDMRTFNNYFSKTGLLVRNHSLPRENYKVNTFNPIGVNMSVKREVYSDFRLLPMTIRGINYEPYLCLHAYEKGLPCALINDNLSVEHFDRDSMSRPKTLNGVIERFAEASLSIYYLAKKGYTLDLRRLKMDLFFKSIPWRLRNNPLTKAQLQGIMTGIKISLYALKEKKNEVWIRNTLKQIQGGKLDPIEVAGNFNA